MPALPLVSMLILLEPKLTLLRVHITLVLPHHLQHHLKPSSQRPARNPSTSPPASKGVSQYQNKADMADMQPCLGFTSYLLEMEGVLATLLCHPGA